MPDTPGTNIKLVLSNEGGRCIELLHDKSDPSIWIIRSSKKMLGFKTKTSTVWFASEQLARTFAKNEADGHRSLRTASK